MPKIRRRGEAVFPPSHLAAIGREPGGPCLATILNGVRRRPDFEAADTQARLLNADFLFDEARAARRP